MGRKPQNSSVSLPNGRRRTLSPGFFQDSSVLSLCPLDRILFAGLWPYADRSGRLLDRPIDLKIRILPADDHDVDAALNRLAANGLIKRYRVGGEAFIALKERPWTEIQRIHKHEPKSAIPPPPTRSQKSSRPSPIVLADQNTDLTPLLRPGSTGPTGSTGSTGPTTRPPKRSAKTRQQSEQEQLFEMLEYLRVRHCEELGVEAGESPRGRPNADFNEAAKAAAITDEIIETNEGQVTLTRWDQMRMLFKRFLLDDFGRVDDRNGEQRKVPWVIWLFLRPGVLRRLKQQYDAAPYDGAAA